MNSLQILYHVRVRIRGLVSVSGTERILELDNVWQWNDANGSLLIIRIQLSRILFIHVSLACNE